MLYCITLDAIYAAVSLTLYTLYRPRSVGLASVHGMISVMQALRAIVFAPKCVSFAFWAHLILEVPNAIEVLLDSGTIYDRKSMDDSAISPHSHYLTLQGPNRSSLCRPACVMTVGWCQSQLGCRVERPLRNHKHTQLETLSNPNPRPPQHTRFQSTMSCIDMYIRR